MEVLGTAPIVAMFIYSYVTYFILYAAMFSYSYVYILHFVTAVFKKCSDRYLMFRSEVKVLFYSKNYKLQMIIFSFIHHA